MTVIDVRTPRVAPAWALLERQLLEAQSRAVEEYHAHYFDERGYLLCVPRWSGDDGPDDALENLLNWGLLHSLGANDRVLELYKHGLEGHFRRYTEAKTVEVELGRLVAVDVRRVVADAAAGAVPGVAELERAGVGRLVGAGAEEQGEGREESGADDVLHG